MTVIAQQSSTAEPADRVLVLSRLYDAPRRLVFAAWTEPEQLVHWWGPRGFTVLSCEVDARVGGAWRVRVRSAQGSEHTSGGIFHEIVPPELLVFSHAWEGSEDGEPGHATLVVVSFAEEAGKTRMTFRQSVFASASSRDAHETGWAEAFDLLDEYLDTERSRTDR